MGKIGLLFVALLSVLLLRNTSLQDCLCLCMLAELREREVNNTLIVMWYKMHEGKEETIKSSYLDNNKEIWA